MAASDEPDGEVVNGSGGTADGSGGVEGGAAEVSPAGKAAAGGTSEQGGEQNGDEKQKNDDSGTNGKGAIRTLLGVPNNMSNLFRQHRQSPSSGDSQKHLKRTTQSTK